MSTFLFSTFKPKRESPGLAKITLTFQLPPDQAVYVQFCANIPERVRNLGQTLAKLMKDSPEKPQVVVSEILPDPQTAKKNLGLFKPNSYQELERINYAKA